MTIANGTSGASSVDTTSVTTTVATKPLYPATFGEEQGATKGKFMTGYGTDLNDGSLNDNYKETTKKIQTQEMLIFPGFSLCPLICGTPQKSINFLR